MQFSPLNAIEDIQRLSWTLRRKPLESFLAPQAAVPSVGQRRRAGLPRRLVGLAAAPRRRPLDDGK